MRWWPTLENPPRSSPRRKRPCRAGSCKLSYRDLQRVRDVAAHRAARVAGRSGFYSHNVVACKKANVSFSVTAKLHKGAIYKAIEGIESRTGWRSPTSWTGLTWPRPPISLKRTRGHVSSDRAQGPAHPRQSALLFTEFSYHAFVTDRDGEMLELEADHRRHAEIENTIRDFKYGVGLNHLPSGRFGANAAWLALNVMAHNLARSPPGSGSARASSPPRPSASLPDSPRAHDPLGAANDALPVRWPWADSS